MRKQFLLMMICGGLLAGIVVPVRGGEEIQPGASAARVFNVLDFGVMGDDKTNNTEVFSACLNAVIAAGGGRVLLPDGVYRGRLIIPPVSKPL